MKKIFISAGHDFKDPGAVANGTTEAKVVTEFRDIISYYLEKSSVPHTTDGKRGENLPLREAIKLIPKGGLAFEFHLNASGNITATGVETLSGDDHLGLGARLCTVIAERMKIRNRGAKGESSGQHSRLAFVQGGGIIVELFFLSNAEDLKKYQAVKWLLAKEVSDFIIKEALA